MKYPKTHFIDSPRTYLFTAENHTSSEYSKKQHQFIIVLLIYTLFYYVLLFIVYFVHYSDTASSKTKGKYIIFV
jgi:hypothetical protein